MHGGNRLASNSLLECVVCAYEVAEFLRNSDLSFDIPKNEKFDKIISKYEIPNVENKIDVQNLKSKLKDLMWNNVGIYRNEKSLNDAINGLNELEKEFPKQDKYLSYRLE